MHRNAGVDARFLVVDTPLDLWFALVWGEFQDKAASFRIGIVIVQWSAYRHRAIGGGDGASCSV